MGAWGHRIALPSPAPAPAAGPTEAQNRAGLACKCEATAAVVRPSTFMRSSTVLTVALSTPS